MPIKQTETFTKFIMTTLAGLLATGIAGIWSLSNNVARLEERVSSLTINSEKTLVALAADVRTNGQRLTVLEVSYRRDEQPPRYPTYPPRDMVVPPAPTDKQQRTMRQ